MWWDCVFVQFAKIGIEFKSCNFFSVSLVGLPFEILNQPICKVEENFNWYYLDVLSNEIAAFWRGDIIDSVCNSDSIETRLVRVK